MFKFLKCVNEPPPQYIIKPNSDGSWYVTKATLSGYGIYYTTVEPRSYKTVKEAEKAVKNLKREWIKIP